MNVRFSRSRLSAPALSVRALTGRIDRDALLEPMRTGAALRVAAVWARDYAAARPVGRVNICRFRRRSLEERYTVLNLIVPSVLQRGVAGGLRILPAAGRALLRGDRSLQSLLFANRPAIDRALAALARFRPDVMVVDSVRLFDLVLAVRRLFPALRIVVDMDDLLSRRMAEWLAVGGGIGLGYLEESIPSWLRGLLGLGWISRVITAHERDALAREEIELCRRVDAVALISDHEARLLEERLADYPEIVPPRIATLRPHWRAERELAPLDGRLRFVFLGSDRLLQNRATIDYLIELWRTLRPPRPLVIFGDQSRRAADLPPGVELRGWIDDLDQVYDGRSILLAPTFVRGGVKTKILEALAFGCPVLANDAAYEGIVAEPPALGFDRDVLPRLLTEPEAFRSELLAQTRSLRIEIASRFAEPLVVEALERLLDPRPALHLVPQSA